MSNGRCLVAVPVGRIATCVREAQAGNGQGRRSEGGARPERLPATTTSHHPRPRRPQHASGRRLALYRLQHPRSEPRHEVESLLWDQEKRPPTLIWFPHLDTPPCEYSLAIKCPRKP